MVGARHMPLINSRLILETECDEHGGGTAIKTVFGFVPHSAAEYVVWSYFVGRGLWDLRWVLRKVGFGFTRSRKSRKSGD